MMETIRDRTTADKLQEKIRENDVRFYGQSRKKKT